VSAIHPGSLGDASPEPALRLRSVQALWLRHVLSLLRVWRVALTWFVVEPGIVLVAVALGIGRLVGEMETGGSYAAFVTPGIVIGTAMFHALFECSWSVYQRITQSLYETVLTAPVTVTEIVLAELAFATTRALLSTLAIGGLAAAVGWMPLAAWPGLLLVSVGVGLVFGAIGLLFAALAPTLHALSLVFTVVATPLYFFSGAFFPIEVLPRLLQPVAWAAPLTALVHLGRAFAMGGWNATHALAAAWVLVLIGVLVPLAIVLMRRRLLK
jgi:lipooligosaccharide transport system permease protein